MPALTQQPQPAPGPTLSPSGVLTYQGSSTELQARITSGELQPLTASCLCIDGHLAVEPI